MNKNTGFIISFLFPALAFYVLMALIPIVYSLYFAFFDWPGIHTVPLKFVGFGNFVKMFTSPRFLLSLKNVAWFVFLNVVFQTLLGYGIALLLGTYLRGFKQFKLLFFLPVVLPMTATSLLWKFIFLPNPTGVLNSLLSLFGVDAVAWLLDAQTAMNCIAAANIWQGFGYHLIIAFAAITTVSTDMIEAATIDGCNRFQRVMKIILPSIRNAIMISIILNVTGNLKNFDIVFVMTEGGPNNLTHVPSTLMYVEAFKYDHYGLGSAIAAFIFALSLLVTGVSTKLLGSKENV